MTPAIGKPAIGKPAIGKPAIDPAARVEPGTRRLSGDPLVEVRIAFVAGPNGEVIEFMQSEQI